jgi:hypothetical protein
MPEEQKENKNFKYLLDKSGIFLIIQSYLYIYHSHQNISDVRCENLARWSGFFIDRQSEPYLHGIKSDLLAPPV